MKKWPVPDKVKVRTKEIRVCRREEKAICIETVQTIGASLKIYLLTKQAIPSAADRRVGGAGRKYALFAAFWHEFRNRKETDALSIMGMARMKITWISVVVSGLYTAQYRSSTFPMCTRRNTATVGCNSAQIFDKQEGLMITSNRKMRILCEPFQYENLEELATHTTS